MCTPTRTSLLTGRYPGRFGPHATVPSNAPVLPDGYETLATVLRNNGYDTALFGKWHLGSHPQFGSNGFGFKKSYGSLAGGVDPYSHRYKRGEYSVTWHRDGELLEETGHVTDLIAREAVEWIESRQQPWFCYVPFTAVHVPVKPVHAWLDVYQAEKLDDDPLKDASFKKYAAYTSHMDAAIGKLLQALEVTCQRENTIVVFSSDNGAINDCPIHGTDLYPGWQESSPRLGSNLPYRGVKAQLYEGGIRTPAIINWRSRLEPGVIEDPVNIVDWMPIFTGLTGSSPTDDPQWDGIDIWPLISGSGATYPERSFYWNFRGGAQLGFRQGGWKYVSVDRNDPGKMELYNVAEDPYETRELSHQHPEIARDLAGLIRQQRERDGTSRRDDVA